MVKRLFAILIAATMLSISIPTSVFAEEINDNGQPVTTDDEDEDNIYAQEYKLYLPDKKLLQQKLREWIEESDKKSYI